MGRLADRFRDLRARGEGALLPFVTAGDPDLEFTEALVLAFAAAGADGLEIGVPFSDPIADGPTIQRASQRALASHTSLRRILDLVKRVRPRVGVPLVLMGYANPFERYDQRHGDGAFVADARAAGVDGVLVVDYPPKECEAFAARLRAAGMDPIFLLAPTSTEQRMRDVGRIARGYAYCVSLKGVTGAGHLDVSAVVQMLPRIRAHVPVPLAVGFGIRDAATARAVAQVADAVVIGSRLVQLLAAEPRDNVAAAARDFIAGIRVALDAPTGDNGSSASAGVRTGETPT